MRILAKKLLLVGLSLALLSGCASEKKVLPEKPVGQLYNEAMDEIENDDKKKAIELFDEVERQHPYSVWAAKSQVMTAYLYYTQAQYTDAILAVDRFLQLHPGNKYAPYALYLKGMCYYEQISDVSRDQYMTEKALDSFSRLVALYPKTDYAKDVKAKILLTHNQLAGKEMDIGRYYLKQKKYGAALNRFADVVRLYPQTMYIQEALYRLTATYLALGLKDEARRSAAVLGYNYPKSEWYKRAFALLDDKEGN